MDTIKKVKDTILQAYKTKSFGFAFWGVFILGSIFFGVLMSALAEIIWRLGFQSNTLRLGYLSLWGYIHLAYFIFSTSYVYQKSNLLTLTCSKGVNFFLGFYVCFSIVTFWTTGQISILFLVGGFIFDVASGGTLLSAFTSYLPIIGEFSLNVLECASKTQSN